MVIARRPLRGSRLSSFYPPVPSEGPSLSDLESAFQLQEYIAQLIRKNPHDVDKIVTPPGKIKAIGDMQEQLGEKDGKGEVVVDEACWIYEHLRRLAQDLTHPLITSLEQECTRASCPEMKAGEWLYLCVAHGNDGAMEQCCAIDYIVHTLDSATALLNSPRAFPSRISIPHASLRHFSSLARRLGRIFSHAYFHHREVFESAEAESSLYARFLAFTARFDLVPAEFLVIPPRMLPESSTEHESDRDASPPRLLGASLDPLKRQQDSQSTHAASAEYATERIDNERSFAEIGLDRPWSPGGRNAGPGQGINGSPRKLGRNRTDTMIFSDVAAFNEEMRAGLAGHGDDEHEDSEKKHVIGVEEPQEISASSSGLSAEDKQSAVSAGAGEEISPAFFADHTSASGEPETEAPTEKENTVEIPHVNTLHIVAQSTESCEPHQTCPYSTGTMATIPSDPTSAVAGEEPQEEHIADSDEADLADLVERKRQLDEAQSKSEDTENDTGISEGSGGYIIIGDQGEVCVPESHVEHEAQTGAQAEVKVALTDVAGNSMLGSASHPPAGKGIDNAVPSELIEDPSSESESEKTDDAEEHQDVSAPESEVKEADVEDEANQTFEGDLEDVEKVLQD